MQIDHLNELERAREIGRLQRNVTEGSQALTHRALQIGQVVGGSIGGLASVGLNFGVGRRQWSLRLSEGFENTGKTLYAAASPIH